MQGEMSCKWVVCKFVLKVLIHIHCVNMLTTKGLRFSLKNVFLSGYKTLILWNKDLMKFIQIRFTSSTVGGIR